jgi:hypothetical protein
MIKEREQNRANIFHTLESVPYIIQGVDEIIRVFPDDDSLKIRVRDMYREVILAIPRLIDILLRKQKDKCRLQPVI